MDIPGGFLTQRLISPVTMSPPPVASPLVISSPLCRRSAQRLHRPAQDPNLTGTTMKALRSDTSLEGIVAKLSGGSLRARCLKIKDHDYSAGHSQRRVRPLERSDIGSAPGVRRRAR